MTSTVNNVRSLPQPTSKDMVPRDDELQGQMFRNKSGLPSDLRAPHRTRAEASSCPSPQQQLQLCLPSFLELQLLLDDLLHPGCIGQGLLPPGQLDTLQFAFLLQERLQDPPVCLLGGGGRCGGQTEEPTSLHSPFCVSQTRPCRA